MDPIPEHGPCFVCGSENLHSMGVTWWARDDGAVVTDVTLTEAHQGPPGYARGGALAALLDEAMGAAMWRAGYTVAAVNLVVEYRPSVPLGETRLADGTVAVVARGIYMEAPQLFDRMFYQDEDEKEKQEE